MVFTKLYSKEDVMETSISGWVWGGIGFVATVALGFFSPYIMSGLSQAARPIVKGVVKGCLQVEATYTDLVAEAQAELTNSSSS